MSCSKEKKYRPSWKLRCSRKMSSYDNDFLTLEQLFWVRFSDMLSKSFFIVLCSISPLQNLFAAIDRFTALSGPWECLPWDSFYTNNYEYFALPFPFFGRYSLLQYLIEFRSVIDPIWNLFKIFKLYRVS